MTNILNWGWRDRQRSLSHTSPRVTSEPAGIARRQPREAGQVAALLAVSMTVLLLMAGLGVDVGYLRYQKEQMQKAADAAAIAGAIALGYNGAVTAAARADASANGFTHNSNGVTVTVNNPPVSGPFAGNHGYVEVIVAQPRPTFFMRVGGFGSVNVSARAVSSTVQKATACIFALDPTDSGSFLIDGNVTIYSTCGILVNSSDSSAILKNGASGSVTASYIGVVGGYSGSGFTPTPTTGIAHFSDPLAGIPQPTPASGCLSAPSKGGTLQPGTYCNGLTFHGNGTYTFQPGLYTIEGGWTVSGAITMSGTGVTFFLTKDSSGNYNGISMHGNETASFSAPTDGSNGGVPGVLFFQDRSLPVGSATSTFGGTAGNGYIGSLYFPTTTLQYKGNPSVQTTQTIIVGYELDFRGDSYMTDYTQLSGGGGPIPSSVLAE
ncbi:MAG TPA: Tad domain-containing protein [Terriglobales bacterium]|nr:Tad domain-containing protein [Terriglobales bacterium]